MTATDEISFATEVSKVLSWKIERLIALGVSADDALSLAQDSERDWHRLFDLLDAGCPLDTALRIV